MRKVNIGCATYHAPGFINIDINPLVKPDMVRDVTRGLPFDDSSVGEVLTSHFLEHIDSRDLLFLVGEIYRVLAGGGVWSIVVPLGNTGDLDHRMQFTEDSFDGLTRPENAVYYQIQMRWEIVEGSRRVVQEPRPHVQSLQIKLRAIK